MIIPLVIWGLFVVCWATLSPKGEGSETIMIVANIQLFGGVIAIILANIYLQLKEMRNAQRNSKQQHKFDPNN